MPFTPGRMDASQEQTEIESVNALEPGFDGLRNFLKTRFSIPAKHLLIDRAQLLTLTSPEMTALVGGLRALKVSNKEGQGRLTDCPETLTNDFFVNLFDMDTEWKATSRDTFEGTDRKTGQKKWSGSRVDLVFGSHSVLRALSEVYAAGDGKEKFVKDFVAAWAKVMDLDHFDVKK